MSVRNIIIVLLLIPFCLVSCNQRSIKRKPVSSPSGQSALSASDMQLPRSSEDRLFPISKDMIAYKKVADLYHAKKSEEAYELFMTALKQGVSCISASEQTKPGDKAYSIIVRSGGILRYIARSNIDFAEKLVKENKWDKAKQVILTNFEFARKVAYARPSDTIMPYLFGKAIWSSSTKALIEQAKMTGHNDLAAQVVKYQEKAEQYKNLHICPLMEKITKADAKEEAKIVRQVRKMWSENVGWIPRWLHK